MKLLPFFALLFAVAGCEGGRHFVGVDATGPDGHDAAGEEPDAGPVIDAMPRPDGGTGEIVANNQAADLVLGQPDFTTAADPGFTSASITPHSIAFSNGTLWISDVMRGRALAWAPLPTANSAAATRLVGRYTFTDSATQTAITSSNLGTYPCVAAVDGKLLVADPGRNRILLWSPGPTTNGASPSLLLGQTSPTAGSGGNASTQLRGPCGMWSDGTKLVVADTFNHRVLIWTTFPTTYGEAADLVLGHTDFGVSTAPASPSDSRLKHPSDVWSDGTRLVVADGSHHRVLIWTTFPTQNGQAADLVLGQESFTTATTGLSQTTMSGPTRVTGNADALFVADSSNDRVLVFAPIPTTTGAAATYVLGQPDFTSGANNPSPTATSLDTPMEVEIVGDYLWVGDQAHGRALRFGLYGQ